MNLSFNPPFFLFVSETPSEMTLRLSQSVHLNTIFLLRIFLFSSLKRRAERVRAPWVGLWPSSLRFDSARISAS